MGLESFITHSVRFWVDSNENTYSIIDGASLLFHVVLEPLAIGIRNRPSFKGIPAGALESHIIFYADDVMNPEVYIKSFSKTDLLAE